MVIGTFDAPAGGGLFGGDSIIASDDKARAIRQATANKDVKTIILRVDPPGRFGDGVGSKKKGGGVSSAAPNGY